MYQRVNHSGVYQSGVTTRAPRTCRMREVAVARRILCLSLDSEGRTMATRKTSGIDAFPRKLFWMECPTTGWVMSSFAKMTACHSALPFPFFCSFPTGPFSLSHPLPSSHSVMPFVFRSVPFALRSAANRLHCDPSLHIDSNDLLIQQQTLTDQQ